ncbi:MAG: PilZ domain-containing protein [Romboutsia sp.]|nr:PilZ domain-containing protein [Romboutsia sp.]
MKENRKAVRVDAQGIIQINDLNSGKKASGYLKDLSISGVGFFSYDKFEINEHIKLIFEVDKQKIFLEGTIVFASYNEANVSRYGVEIEEINNENYEILKSYVTKGIQATWSQKIRKYSGVSYRK